MAFVRFPGLKGKVYAPETPVGAPRKHPCKDCFVCQQCGNNRCTVCLQRTALATEDDSGFDCRDCHD